MNEQNNKQTRKDEFPDDGIIRIVYKDENGDVVYIATDKPTARRFDGIDV
jgi:hypothetical protein